MAIMQHLHAKQHKTNACVCMQQWTSGCVWCQCCCDTFFKKVYCFLVISLNWKHIWSMKRNKSESCDWEESFLCLSFAIVTAFFYNTDVPAVSSKSPSVQVGNWWYRFLRIRGGQLRFTHDPMPEMFLNISQIICIQKHLVVQSCVLIFHSVFSFFGILRNSLQIFLVWKNSAVVQVLINRISFWDKNWFFLSSSFAALSSLLLLHSRCCYWAAQQFTDWSVCFHFEFIIDWFRCRAAVAEFTPVEGIITRSNWVKQMVLWL